MDNLKCIVENVYSHIQQNEGAIVTKYELVKLSSKPYLNAMLQDNLVSLIRKTGIYALKLEISHTMPESTAPATIHVHEMDTNDTSRLETSSTDDEHNRKNIEKVYLGISCCLIH